MTSRNYYKMVFDQSYHLDDWFYCEDSNSITAYIEGFEGFADTEQFLKENDFFHLDNFHEKLDAEKKLEFRIVFNIDDDKYIEYELGIDNTIVTRTHVADGGLAIQCCWYEMTDNVMSDDDECGDCDECTREDCLIRNNEEDDIGRVGIVTEDKGDEEENNKKDEKKDENKKDETKPVPFKPFSFDFSFPKFGDFFSTDVFKLFDEMSNSIGKTMEELKNDKNVRFCEVSYKTDGKGNGIFRRADNDGITERRFTRAEDGSVKLDDKTELKDLIK